ncbi:hypothetical protein [Promicromonospora sp. NPDC023805]|uniref:hypothetical protein n=1 Tax=Promicromonospora sp. NPDC023805 TaxID=3154696 RepID=UPI0033CE90D3
MDRLHAEPRSDDPEVNAIGQLPRSEVEAILRDVDHPLHAAAVEHRRLLNLALRPMVDRVSRVLNGLMRSQAAAEMPRSMGIVGKYLAAAALPGVEAVRRELAAIAPVLNTLGQQIAADSMRSSRLAQRNAALMTKLVAMEPPPGISTARLGGSVRDPFGLTRPAPDPLVGLADLVAQTPRGPSVAARPAAANRHVPAGGTATAAGQAEMNRHLVAIKAGFNEQRADGRWSRASAVRMEIATWATLLVGVATMLGFGAPAEVEQNINVFVVEGQALDHLPSQTPTDDPPLPPPGCLDEPPFPVPSTVPECVPRSWCAH